LSPISTIIGSNRSPEKKHEFKSRTPPRPRS
jgi:hypothetical protein